jgi:hypothetical protein
VAKRLPRPTLLLIRNTVLCWLFLVLLCGVSEAQSEPPDPPTAFSDMLAVQGPDENATVYLADATRGAIYSLSVSVASPQQLAFSDFHLFFKCQEFPKPSALAYQDGKLFIYDAQVPALFSIDVTAAKQTCSPTVILDEATLKDLLKEKSLKPPISLAVSNGGSVALSGTDNEKFLWYDRDKSARLILHSPQSLKPKRLAFDENDLIVLNGEGDIFALPEKGLTSQDPNALRSVQIEVPAKSKSEFSSAKDTDFYANIFYVTDGQRVVAFPASKGKDSSAEFLLPVALPIKKITSLSRLSVTQGYLFVADIKNNLIWNLPRPVPSTVSIEDTDTASETQLALYEYLFSHGLLPLRGITAETAYPEVEALVASENLLLPGLQESVNRSPTHRSLLTQMARFICKINEWSSCAVPNRETGQYAAKQIGVGQRIVLPDIPISSSLRMRQVHLNGKQSVKDYLNEHVLLPDQVPLVTGRYIAARNEANLSTPSAILARDGFMMVSPDMKNAQPGTLVSFSQGRETMLGSINDCGTSLNDEIQRSPYSLPPTIVSQRLFDLLPAEGDSHEKGVFNKRNIQKIEANFESVIVEKLSLELLQWSLNQCQTQLSSGKNYIVLESLKVPNAKYKFLRKDGTVALITDEDFQRLNVRGTTDPEKLWSVLSTEPLYFGMRLAEIYKKDDQTFGLKAVSDPSSLMPEKSEDIFGIKDGVLNLPATTWQLSVLINTTDLTDASSEWRQRMAKYTKTYLLSKQRTRIAPVGSPSFSNTLSLQEPPPIFVCNPTIDEPQKCLQVFKAARDKQLSAINYVPLDKSNVRLPTVVVGIAELSNNTRRDISAFLDDNGQSAWFEKSDECGWKRRTALCPSDPATATENPNNPTSPSSSDTINPSPLETPTPVSPLVLTTPPAPTPTPTNASETPLSIAEFQYPFDHGTFVAGLLAARSHGQPEKVGLLPQIGLFLIDLNDPSPDELINAIIYAVDNKVRIFNFSFEITKPMDDPTNTSQTDYSGAVQKMADMKDVLFVVAAGNNNHDLRTSYHMPIAWGTEVQNMIGVGASDNNSNFAKIHQTDNQSYPVSNYSKKHIQLIAPGVDIYSIKPPNLVTKHSGSSYAAPQVTAAATMLHAQHVTGAMRIKARLIYTADWNANYSNNRGEVWGGMLNYKNAVWEPHRNLLKLSDVETTWAVEVDGDPKIKIKQGIYYAPDNEPPLLDPLEIKFKQILRIQRYRESDNKFYRRIIYLDRHGYVKVINKASIEDKTIRFSTVSKYNGTDFQNASFSPDGKKEILVNSLENYIAETPENADIGRWVNPWVW